LPKMVAGCPVSYPCINILKPRVTALDPKYWTT
jgi:hypothetical protein